ncbi:MAG TPA: type III-A CRISPR-associated protein Cas10/Csm1, partial [Ferrovaceae bacterium]|nr:type III-A CRISPR-associated protein Cas10/Csm1 [Ferrovaceae bacterium]
MNMLNQSSRVALAALLHDLGKLAERARIESNSNDIDGNKNTYCPKTPMKQGGRHTHVHAAYTGLAWDELEKTGHFPNLKKNCDPFKEAEAGGVFPDSAVNAAAAHHRPETFLQWIMATADRVASGFEREEFENKYNTSKERENHYRARLITLFEQIGMGEIEEGSLKWRYPLKSLTPQNLFPSQDCIPSNNEIAQDEYLNLWEELITGLKKIPKSHQDNLPLWLDHFDSLWLNITHAIPSATAFGIKPEVSLYDHSKTVAALATALWCWHRAHQLETVESLKEGWNDKKMLLVQGEFFGIQNFIFSEGGDTNKHAHKLLRGRSFQVALLAECAALKLLDALELPPTSQIINAAGKLLIVAPNTKAAQDKIKTVLQELNDWCLQHTYGEIGFGIATTPASCNDFSHKNFGDLQRRLFAELDKAKHQRFNLCTAEVPTVFTGFLDQFSSDWGVCRINGRYPADMQCSVNRGYALSRLADDQISIGEALTKKTRVVVSRDKSTLPSLVLDYFGWYISFVPEEEVSGKYGQIANERLVVRIWDFDLPDADGKTFHGYARRFVNTYVARFNEADEQTADKYGKWEDEVEFDREHPIKTLNHLACEDRLLLESGKWRGEIALLALKGDIDNLGALFQQGLQQPTFAKMASLSRQINFFFALWLPWFCEYGTEQQVTR